MHSSDPFVSIGVKIGSEYEYRMFEIRMFLVLQQIPREREQRFFAVALSTMNATQEHNDQARVIWGKW